jgi:2-amino-4-hydroxy-6-hydroxymethyldihydropteridine diphosphokinase
LTQLAARELLEGLLGIEQSMGRRRQERWGPRVIDLDLIWILGEPVDEPGLTVPHPGVSTRNFVLYPLADIAPTLVIPGHGNVSELARRAGGDGISILE